MHASSLCRLAAVFYSPLQAVREGQGGGAGGPLGYRCGGHEVVMSMFVVFFVACLKILGVKRLSCQVHRGKIFAGKASESLQVWPCSDLCIFCLPELAFLELCCYCGINNTILNIPSNVILPFPVYGHYACTRSASRNLTLRHSIPLTGRIYFTTSSSLLHSSSSFLMPSPRPPSLH